VPPINLVSHFSRNRSFTRSLLGHRRVTGKDDERVEQFGDAR